MRKIFACAAAFVLLLGVAAPDAALRSVLVSERHRRLDGLAPALDGPPTLATRAALAIGRVGDPAGRGLLEAHIGVRDPGERAMVAFALGLLDDTSMMEWLRHVAAADDSSSVRYAAVDALGRIVARDPKRADARTAANVLFVARRDADRVVRAHAAAQLDAFRLSPSAPEIASELQTLLAGERDETVRWHLAWVLSRAYGDRLPASTILTYLRDRNEVVRIAAIRMWAHRPGAAIAPLRPLLADSSWRVQLEARAAIAHLEGRPAVEHLKTLPPGLHLPPLARGAAPQESALPRPAASAKPGALADGEARIDPLLLPATAQLMNGPMPGPHPRVRIETTKGAIVLRLYPEWAPYTVANFLSLANHGYYDGLRFFRVVPDFVVQTGDAANTGSGDAGFTIGAELNPIEERSGVVAMALDYENGHAVHDSAGTQFYITLSPQLHLDRDFTVFGEVVRGFGVLPRLVESDRMLRISQLPDG